MEPMSFDDLFIRYTNLNQEPNKSDRNDSDSSPMEDPKVNLFSVAMSLRRKEKGCNVMPLELRLLQTIRISLFAILSMYSRLRNKHRARLINFWNFFQGLHFY